MLLVPRHWLAKQAYPGSGQKRKLGSSASRRALISSKQF
jgi:hypothetical protein